MVKVERVLGTPAPAMVADYLKYAALVELDALTRYVHLHTPGIMARSTPTKQRPSILCSAKKILELKNLPKDERVSWITWRNDLTFLAKQVLSRLIATTSERLSNRYVSLPCDW